MEGSFDGPPSPLRFIPYQTGREWGLPVRLESHMTFPQFGRQFGATARLLLRLLA